MSLSDPSPLGSYATKLASRSTLSEEERQAIADLPAYAAQIETNRDFVKLGEEVDSATFVVEGLVGRFGQGRDGNRQIVAIHMPGDMANLNSVVAPSAGAALQALSVTTVLRVPHKGLRELAQLHPAIAAAFWLESAVDASVLAEWIVNVGRRDSLSRTAHLLCELACRQADPDGAAKRAFGFPATQSHMADMLGLTPVHVNRMIRQLRDSEIAVVGARMVQIIDWDRLADTGDFDGAYLHVERPYRCSGWARSAA